MKLKVTGRHMDITPALQQYLDTRFGRLDRYGLKLGQVQVVLEVEKLQHKAEVMCSVNGKRVQAKTATREMYASIDALVDRLDAQLRKWKDRLVSHKPGSRRTTRDKRFEAMPSPPPKRPVAERRAVPILSIEEAHEQLSGSASPFLLFINSETGAVQVAQRVTGGRTTVIEPYPAGSREQSVRSGASL